MKSLRGMGTGSRVHLPGPHPRGGGTGSGTLNSFKEGKTTGAIRKPITREPQRDPTYSRLKDEAKAE